MIPNSIAHVKLEGQVWNAVIDERTAQMFIDVRDEEEKTIEIVCLDLASMEIASKQFDLAWWCHMADVVESALFFVEYQDQHDPNRQHYFKLNWNDGIRERVSEIPNMKKSLTLPFIYEQGSSYHQTVAEFLAMELSLSCEYLEWGDKIIISYYLRSGNGFDRYLLLLEDGKKAWKLNQDEQMKGFSSGSFFVFQEQLIFIKDRNEVCVYSG